MTNPLTSLVGRLEKAEEGDRKLDRDIFLLVTPDWLERGIELCDATIPRYTTSVDAALTLVPKGWFIPTMGERRTPVVYAGDKHEHIGYFARAQWIDGGGRLQHGDARTLALALCIAALRARQQGEG